MEFHTRRFRVALTLGACAILAAFAASLGFARRTSTHGAAVATLSADTQRVTIAVSGMYCESCEATVHAMLKRTRGVYSATVDVNRGLATVAYDPRQTTPSALADVINRLGYKATLPKPTGRATAGKPTSGG